MIAVACAIVLHLPITVKRPEIAAVRVCGVSFAAPVRRIIRRGQLDNTAELAIFMVNRVFGEYPPVRDE